MKKGRKDKDDDLLLFKDLHNRQKERLPTLLQPPVSDEFEPTSAAAGGSYALYKLNNASWKKGSTYEFSFGEINDKNDYDWLKTPPATPLFPSLEMEASSNAHHLLLQREIPIAQPLSRFATGAENLKVSSASKPKIPPQRCIKPASHRPHRPSQSKVEQNPRLNKPTNNDQTTPKKPAAVVSPRVLTSHHMKQLSNDTPPNLRMTCPATSATRGRSVSVTHTIQSSQRSCLPSVTRARNQPTLTTPKKGKSNNIAYHNNGTQILESRRIVDNKIINARELVAEERFAKQKPLAMAAATTSGSNNSNERTTASGGGRIASDKSSLDMAFKHMDIKQDWVNFRRLRFATGRGVQKNE